MNKELDQKLCSEYPEIFKDRHGDMTKTAMVWGFECADGWYPLIDTLCRGLMQDVWQLRSRVERIEEALAEQDKSDWSDWQRETYTQEKLDGQKQQLAKALEELPVAMQVKEKFGGLRFYVHGGTDRHRNYIDFAESMSYRTCEVCGMTKDAMTYNLGYVRTLCPEHAKEQYGDDAGHYRNKTGPFAPDQE